MTKNKAPTRSWCNDNWATASVRWNRSSQRHHNGLEVCGSSKFGNEMNRNMKSFGGQRSLTSWPRGRAQMGHGSGFSPPVDLSWDYGEEIFRSYLEWDETEPRSYCNSLHKSPSPGWWGRETGRASFGVGTWPPPGRWAAWLCSAPPGSKTSAGSEVRNAVKIVRRDITSWETTQRQNNGCGSRRRLLATGSKLNQQTKVSLVIFFLFF